MIIKPYYRNDGKERYQSHELTVDHEFRPVAASDYHGMLDIGSYGADKEEATENFRAALRHMINDAQETLASLEPKALAEPAEDPSAVERLARFVDVVFQQRVTSAASAREFRRKQRELPTYRLEQLLTELKTKLIHATGDDRGLSYTEITVPSDLSGHVTTFLRAHYFRFTEVPAVPGVQQLPDSVVYRITLPRPAC